MVLNAFASVFLVLCLFAAVHDINRLTIPNWLNLTIAVLFVPAAFAAGLPIEIVGGHLVVAALAFLVAFGLFAFNIFGGGDAKMIPAVMLWMGPNAGFEFVMYMALVGGLCAGVVLMVRRAMPAAVLPQVIRAPFEDNAGVPYGVAIAAGAFLAGSGSPFLANLLS
ncbi:A24 family peptidase [Hyphomonas johnsonii]|jgi:prepilin peptidase CpaA|uniref:Pilus assembly protein CpaA n=1 Tax=Hyphomonas johnsonii MHS-2 TaxID=1280950 RepID=A0A059FQM6_9PROT|nr:prepilin peptidase [Hyphomonas johnsonii]KCZ92763.1 pilus assembly protein CpaA [Hyphomonas johnsonii MHS-2]